MKKEKKLEFLPGELAESAIVCKECMKLLPVNDFRIVKNYKVQGADVYRRSHICMKCEESLATKGKGRVGNKKIPGTYTCKDNCVYYPCFKGMDNIATNLILTCVNRKVVKKKKK